MHSQVMMKAVGTVEIVDETENKILLRKTNAIHPQNMSRIITRALAHEVNSTVHRIAFGSGGTFIDAGGDTVFRNPNDGTNGAGWESRLYRETYSEVVDEIDPFYGLDPGSAGPDNIRIGGGANPDGDPSGRGVFSNELNNTSQITITVLLNEDEPRSQVQSAAAIGNTIEAGEDAFIFDEIGLYSPGKNAVSTPGSASIDVDNKISTDNSTITSGVYSLQVTVDGIDYISQITVPPTGTGTGGAITYGDIAEGINNGSWVTGGDIIQSVAYFFITDRSGGTYPSITGQQSFGFFTIQSKTTGEDSTIDITCIDGLNSDLAYRLGTNSCANVNRNVTVGKDPGVINDAANPENERERLLTHVVFEPVTKTAANVIRVNYTIEFTFVSA